MSSIDGTNEDDEHALARSITLTSHRGHSFINHRSVQEQGGSLQAEDDRNDESHKHLSQNLHHRGFRSQTSEVRISSDQPEQLNANMHQIKKKRRRSRRSLLPSPLAQWMGLLAVVSSVRLIWMSTYGGIITPTSVERKATWSFPIPRLLSGESGRQMRTRPRLPAKIWFAPEQIHLGAKQFTYPSFPPKNATVATDFCGDSMNNERILISGILSHPVASELALSLSRQCGVNHIAGLTEHLLTVDQSQRLEFLMRHLPKLKLQISEYPLTDFHMQQVMDRFDPTIIYHFEPLSFIPGIDQPEIFAMRSSLDQLSRICKALVRAKHAKNFALQGRGPRMIYVNPLRLSRNSLSQSNIVSFHSVQLQTYWSEFGFDAVQLNLPTIYGPFQEGAALLGLNKTSDEFLKSEWATAQPLIHISDAINSIIASAQSTTCESSSMASLPVLTAPKSDIITLGELRNVFKEMHRKPNKAMKHAGKLYPILSWYYRQTTPNTANFSMLPNKEATIKALRLVSKILNSDRLWPNVASQVERRQHNLFPCTSECARQSLSCRFSIWDAIIPISQRATSDCRYLLYTANFSDSIVELPELTVSVNNASWPQPAFCQLAFVSSKSPLVMNALSVDASAVNGNFTSKGWRLIWINETENSLSEADYIMPKIAPSNLFSSQLSKAAYLEPQHMTSIPPLQILCFLMAKRLDASSIPAKLVHRKGHTVILPAVPERHIMLMGHTFDFFLPEVSDPNYMSHLAKLVLSQKGQGIIDDLSVTTRQLQAYTKSLQWQKEKMIPFEPVDSYLLIHNLRYKQSRQLRCHWYEEQLFWSMGRENRDLEDLSLAFVMHRWRRQFWLDTPSIPEIEERWGERMLVEEKELPSDPNSDELSFEAYAKLHSRMKARRVYELDG
ncbi:hypothetical protein IV203_027580 [Nitzschia inconspicua]|uniref:Uncharacterized protein n=1 Tax=Nitzschia inconspicua TaxID=303405 RepID=A0A9K3LXC2_9STRA|nr:hypothetical protein IV203_027580 [Nitzschia inconspicua]